MTDQPQKLDFLSKHLGNHLTLDLGDGYFVKVKPLGKGDIAACQSKLSTWEITLKDQQPDPRSNLDFSAYQEELVARSLVEWNIDGPKGILPIAPLEKARESYRMLPASVADEIFQACDKLNAPPNAAEEARFRGVGEGPSSGSEASPSAPGDGAVHDGEGAVEGTGPESE